MSRIRSKNTQPELVVRRLLHSMGYRYRLYSKKLPGTPDIVLPKYKTAIFIHGCFWHQHKGCRRATLPESNVKYWHEKLAKNIKLDTGHKKQLSKLKWRYLVIWECEIKDVENLSRKLAKWLQI